MLSEDQIKNTLADFAAQHVRQVWVHPRPGLMTPYLGDDWFRLWKLALREAERLDMNVWIYDENSYPSGFAGGLVPEAMPASRGLGLHFSAAKNATKPADNALAVYRINNDGCENITAKVRNGETFPEGDYLIAAIHEAPSSGWFGGKFYVDLLRPGVTDKFLEITMGAYQREIGEHFGDRVPGVFTDEPNLVPAGGLPWTGGFPELFQKRWGYDLIDALPSLVRPLGDWRQVRHDFYRLCLEQFIEHWAKPYSAYCEKHNLEFTGHYWEHEWPVAAYCPDNMAMYAWHQRPAIDNLMNRYGEDVHGQFGNTCTVRELASVANQLGRKRTLCETYGAAGWELRFEDMKRIGDWLYATGVNTLNEHLSYVTIRGARKYDHPQSFSYHEPWWDEYHLMADHFTRLSLALSSGEQINRVLLLEPTTTAWMYQGAAELGPIGDSFQDMVNRLERAQAEYDIGCEDIMGRWGAVEGGLLKVGRRGYDLLILPPLTENLDETTMQLVEKFLAAGGRVLCCGEPPARVDGRVSPRGKQAATAKGWKQVGVDDAIAAAVARTEADGLAIERTAGDRGLLFHQRRRLADGQLLLIVNTSIDQPSAGKIVSDARGAEVWKTDSGEIAPYRFEPHTSGIKTDFSLPPCGSLLLYLADKSLPAAPPANDPVVTKVEPAGEMGIKRKGPNVLTLDYVDVTAGGKTLKNSYIVPACNFVFQQNGMASNPWDCGVQLRDELIKKTFPAESRFTATYRFKLAGDFSTKKTAESLLAVVERPDLYAITCNDWPVSPIADRWWLDKSFGVVDISAAAVAGDNELTLKAAPMTVFHELQAVYLLGDFSLAPGEKGFAIEPPRTLAVDPKAGWNEQGMAFYAHDVCYSQEFEIPQPAGRYRVVLPAWHGSVAKVFVNGQKAGAIGYRPFDCEVTKLIRPGKNLIEVVVTGTLKNTLGPHHAGKETGAAWPGGFHQGTENGPPPGKNYHTVGYGLFEPFRLEKLD